MIVLISLQMICHVNAIESCSYHHIYWVIPFEIPAIQQMCMHLPVPATMVLIPADLDLLCLLSLAPITHGLVSSFSCIHTIQRSLLVSLTGCGQCNVIHLDHHER
eukprot:1063771_1